MMPTTIAFIAAAEVFALALLLIVRRGKTDADLTDLRE